MGIVFSYIPFLPTKELDPFYSPKFWRGSLKSLHSEYEQLYVVQPTHPNNSDLEMNEDNGGTTTSVRSVLESTTSSLSLQDTGQTSITHLSMDESLEEDHLQLHTSCTASGTDAVSSNPYTQEQLVSNWKENNSATESSFSMCVSEDITDGTFITTASEGTEESSIESNVVSTNMSDELLHSNGYVELNNERNTSVKNAIGSTTPSLALQDARQTSVAHLSMDSSLEGDHLQLHTSCITSDTEALSSIPYTQEQLVSNWKESSGTTESSFLTYLSENATEGTFITTASGTVEESSIDLFSTCNMPDKLLHSNPPSGYVDHNQTLI